MKMWVKSAVEHPPIGVFRGSDVARTWTLHECGRCTNVDVARMFTLVEQAGGFTHCELYPTGRRHSFGVLGFLTIYIIHLDSASEYDGDKNTDTYIYES